MSQAPEDVEIKPGRGYSEGEGATGGWPPKGSWAGRGLGEDLQVVLLEDGFSPG